MVGDTNDPEDGAAVAGTVFSAVLVYAVCFLSQRFDTAYRWRIGGGEKERNRSGGMDIEGKRGVGYQERKKTLTQNSR